MGYSARAECLSCGKTFVVNHGGGFHFHLVRCDRCGGEKPVSFEELGELHARYMRGLDVPHSATARNHDSHASIYAGPESLSEDAYHIAVEVFAGTCVCGGTYRFNARPRCPRCHSSNIEEREVVVDYD